jgi:predicted ArsR family transcriptional regulator
MTQQLAFDLTAPRARTSDPATSHEAAASARELRARHNRVILEALRVHGPMGKDGIAARTGLTGVAVARRMSELRQLRLAVETGRRAKSAAGRPETEWSAIV